MRIRTTLLSALLVGLCWLAAGCGSAAKINRANKRGDAAMAAGRYDDAEIEYRSVLLLQPLEPHAISRLGLLFFDEGRFGQAYPFLLKGLDLQPQDIDLHLKMASMSFLINKPDEAREHATFVLDHRPADPDAPITLVNAAREPAELKAVRAKLQSLPPPANTGVPVMVALGALDFRDGKLAEAEAAFVRAEAADPKSALAASALANFYIAQKDLPKGEAKLKKAADLSPPRSTIRIQYAAFELQKGDRDGARRILEQVLKEAPDRIPAALNLAEMALTEKRYSDGLAIIDKVLARDSGMLEALVLAGRLNLAKGDLDKAVSILERAQSFYPDSPQANLTLGQAYLAVGKTDSASSSFNRVLRAIPSTPEAILPLAAIDIQSGNPNNAIVRLKPFLENQPDVYQGWILLADAYRSQRRFAEALASYTELEKNFSANPQVPLLRGVLLREMNRVPEAYAAFEKAKTIDPQYMPALEQLVDLDIAQKNFPAALARIEPRLAEKPNDVGLNVLSAKLQLAQKNWTAAETALRKAISLQPDALTPYVMLAEIYIITHQDEKALADLREASTKDPKDFVTPMLTAILYDRKKNYPEARAAYERTVEINPQFADALNNLAYLYSTEFSQLDKALPLAERARTIRPQDPRIADTLGWILFNKHDYPRALSLLQEAADKLPNDAETQYHLGIARYETGDQARATGALQRAVAAGTDFRGLNDAKARLAVLVKGSGEMSIADLEKLRSEKKDDPVVMARLGSAYRASGAAAKAIAVYEAALKLVPTNTAVLRALAELYETDNPAKALDYASTARKNAPDDPDIAYLLGRLTAKSGDFRRALALFQEAARNRPADPDITYELARAYFGNGQIPEAEAAAQKALGASAFSRATDARGFLKLVSYSKQPDLAAKAAAEIEEAASRNPDDLAALMALGTLQEKTGDTKLAMATYTRIGKLYPGFDPARRRLAALTDAKNAAEKRGADIGIRRTP